MRDTHCPAPTRTLGRRQAGNLAATRFLVLDGHAKRLNAPKTTLLEVAVVAALNHGDRELEPFVKTLTWVIEQGGAEVINQALPTTDHRVSPLRLACFQGNYDVAR